jgi:hypothetical protein
MAAISSTAAGFYDVGGTWVGGVVPVDGDTITILHKVTIRDNRTVGTDPGSASNPANIGASAVVTIGANGELYFSRSASATLTVKGSIVLTATSACLNMGTDTTCASPHNVDDPIPNGVNAEIRFATTGNNVTTGKYGYGDTNGTAGKTYLRGLARTVNTTLSVAGAVSDGSITVTDATNWKVGDRIAIHTSDSTASHIETFGIKAIAGNVVTLGTVAVPATGATLANAHVINTPVTNFTSNVTVGFSSTNYCFFTAKVSSGVTGYNVFLKNASFEYINTPNGLYSSPYSGVGVTVNGSPTTQTELMDDCTIWLGNGGFAKRNTTACVSTYNRLAVYCTTANSPWFNWNSAIVTWANCVGYNTNGTGRLSGVALGLTGYSTYNDCHLVTGYSWGTNQSAAVFLNRCVFGCVSRPITLGVPTTKADTCTFGTFGTTGISNALTDISGATVAFPTLTNCQFVSGIVIQDQMQTAGNMAPAGYLSIVNYNADSTLQQKHIITGTIVRDNSQLIRSRSSIKFSPLSANTAHGETYSIAAVSGVATKFRFGLRYDTNYTNGTPPSVTVSGLGVTPGTFTAGASVNTDYEGTITVTPTSTGNLTITVTGQSTATNGNYWFSGMTFSPWVDWTQHYGYLYAPTSPTITVDPVVQLSEASASALTGLSYGSGTLTVTASRSIREIYDWLKWYEASNRLDPIITSTDGINFALAANLAVTAGTITGTSEVITLATAKTYAFTAGGISQIKVVSPVSGTTTYLTLTGLSGHNIYVQDATPTQVDYQTNVTGTYALFSATGTGTWRWRCVKYGQEPTTATFSAATGPVTAAPAQATDTKITQATAATVAAYTTLENWDKFYDYCQYYLTTSSGKALGKFATASGSAVDIGAINYTDDATAGSVFVYSSPNLTVKATTVIAGTTFAGLTTTGTVSTANGGRIDTWYTSASGRSVLILAASIISGTRYRLYNVTDSTQIANSTAGATGIYERVTWTADKTVSLKTRFVSGTTAKARTSSTATLTNTGVSFLDTQSNDTTYNSNAVSGAACDSGSGGEFTTDFPNVQVDVNDSDNTTSLARVYAWLCYQESTSSGITNFFGAISATDTSNYSLDGSVVDLSFDNKKTALLTINGGYITKSGGAAGLVAATTTGSIYFDSGRAYIADSAAILAKTSQLTFTVANQLDANIQYVNDTQVKGTGSQGNEWGLV